MSDRLLPQAQHGLSLAVSDVLLQEAANIVTGVYAPLTGFLHADALTSVVQQMRLPDGAVWSMPLVLPVSEAVAQRVPVGGELVLTDQSGAPRFQMSDVSVYPHEPTFIAEHLFGTTDSAHPGVAAVLAWEPWLVGGRLTALGAVPPVHSRQLTPQQTKALFAERGWATVAAFQTRNAPHRSHEYLQQQALQHVDGLLVQPVLGPKKAGDLQDEFIIGAYEVLFQEPELTDRAVLATLHTFMRYAGPREAIFHALVRRNFGCTHMIIGRDHAGVGSYYGTYDAQRIFDRFDDAELGITILAYENAAYCRGCAAVVFDGVCTHAADERVWLSGTELRRRFSEGEDVPDEFMRPSVARYLATHRERLFV